MKKALFILLLCSYSVFSQNKVEQYNYGKNGIEYIAKSKNGKTIIISTFNSRPAIKDEVAENVYKYFKENTIINGQKITILANNAKVEGTIFIQTKEQLTSVEFYYATVEWNTGITEVYHNPKLDSPTTIADND